MYQQLWGYKVEEKLYLGVREQKRFNATGIEDAIHSIKTQLQLLFETILEISHHHNHFMG
jgi:hypothetical protein